MEEEVLIKETSDFLVTETTLDPKLPVDQMVLALRQRKTTGQLTFHLSQGGVQKVALTERTKADDEQAADIREILDME